MPAFFPVFETLFIGTFRYGLQLLPQILFYSGKKSAAITRKLILVTAKHLAGKEQVNVRRSLNDTLKLI